MEHISIQRFTIHLNKINTLIEKATKAKASIPLLFANEIRNSMFQVEGLAKMYSGIYKDKSFEKIYAQCKQLEDALGVLDYYKSFNDDIKNSKKYSPEIKSFFALKVEEKINELENVLTKENWLNGKRIKKIQSRLAEVTWLSEKEEINAIKNYYLVRISKIKNFVHETNFEFDHIEHDVHELRRKLRWLSIYAQALQGSAVLQEKKPITPALKKYITPAIKASPYNKLPVPKTQKYFLQLEKNNFYALSFMIAHLANIKDKGLRILALSEALESIHHTKPSNADIQLHLGKNYPSLDALIIESSTSVVQFFKDDVLGNLVL